VIRVAVVMPHPAYPATSGDRIRVAALVDGLRGQDVDPVVLANSWHGESGREGYVLVPGRPSNRMARALWRARLQAARRGDPLAIYRMPGLHDRMARAIESIAPDIVDFQHSYSWFDCGRPSVLTMHNVESDRLTRFGDVTPKQAAAVQNGERAALDAADATIVLSDADAARVREFSHPRALHVVPLGYDPGAKLPLPREELTTIAYVASFDYQPNVEAAQALLARWPAIRSETGVRRLVIIGRAASRHVTSSDSSVEIRSDVPDVRAALEDADALVVPLLSGGGVRVKIIEAFALGLPVVSTELGIEGLEAVDGTHAVVVPDLEGIGEGIRSLQRVGVRRAMVAKAYALWETRYSPRQMATGVLDVYRSVLDSG
jgi:glycosyltransferase involved in cell wall biosynthesis